MGFSRQEYWSWVPLPSPWPSPTPRVYPNSCPSSWWCHPTSRTLSSPSPLSSIFPSIRVFSNESALCIKWPKYWSLSFSPSNEYSGLISFRMDWLNLLAAQETLRNFSNTSVQKHQFFGSQPSLWSTSRIHPYMTTGKTIALTRRTFIRKVMSLLFNTLSRLVILFFQGASVF